jgi:hypothetical protein
VKHARFLSEPQWDKGGVLLKRHKQGRTFANIEIRIDERAWLYREGRRLATPSAGNQLYSLQDFGAGEGKRTLLCSLGSFGKLLKSFAGVPHVSQRPNEARSNPERSECDE